MEQTKNTKVEVKIEFSTTLEKILIDLGCEISKLTDWSPSMIADIFQNALEDAQMKPEDIDYINAHGTSTQLNDSAETNAIKRALGEEAYTVNISSTKSMTGHLLGAAGAVEAVFSIMAMQNNFVPPTTNLHDPDPACDLNYTPNVGVERQINHVMSNAFGFGGHNAVIIMSRFTENGNS